MQQTRREIQPERLRILREDAGYSISGLARAMEVGSIRYLNQAERGIVFPAPAYLKRIADTLSASLRRPVDLDEFTARVPIEDAA